MKEAHVIMHNDYPHSVYVGSLDAATAIMQDIADRWYKDHRWQFIDKDDFKQRIIWHIQTVPLISV